MTDHGKAWHWAVAFFALGAVLLLAVVAVDEPTDGAGTATGDTDRPGGPQPTLTASPTTGLRDGDRITISGGTFRPGDPLDAIICGGPRLFEDGCEQVPSGVGDLSDAVDANGRLEYPYRATALPPRYEGLDCRRDDCFLVVGSGLEHVTASFPLQFDPDSAIAPPPGAFARAVEGNSIEVQGEGFLPGEEVFAATCIDLDDIPYCQSPTPHHATADADGTVDFTFTPEPFEGFDGLSDCRDHRCWVDIEGVSLPHRDIDLYADLALDP